MPHSVSDILSVTETALLIMCMGNCSDMKKWKTEFSFPLLGAPARGVLCFIRYVRSAVNTVVLHWQQNLE